MHSKMVSLARFSPLVRAPHFQVSSVIRFFSANAAKVDGSSSSTNSSSSSGETHSSSNEANRIKNPIGPVYQDMVFRARGNNRLALGELRKLLQLCKTKDDVKYGLQMVELFQIKGQDFSEEVNSHFVSMCVRGEQPHIAIKQFSKYKNRIGAWTTPKSFHNLTSSVMELQKSSAATDAPDLTKELVTALDTVTLKGAKISPESLSLILQQCCEKKDLAMYTTASKAAARCLDKEALAVIHGAHPVPVDAVAETAPN